MEDAKGLQGSGIEQTQRGCKGGGGQRDATDSIGSIGSTGLV